MSELQLQTLLQQRNASKIGGEHLEVLGKQAAVMWSEGRARTLNDAVTSVVKTAGLSPEQVRRVIEFTNTAAYLTEFHKEGSPHRYIDFGPGGPASPSAILQDLNDGGGGTVFDHGSGHYHQPPEHTTKTASVWEEQALASMFGGSDTQYPEVNPLGDAIDLRDKLGAAYQQTTAMLNDLEAAHEDLHTHLFNQVKQAALSGHSLSEIVEIWSERAPSAEHVKTAFAGLMEPLITNGVFRSHDDFIASLEKRASVGMVNEEHPLVAGFVEYCDVITKLAETREAQKELGEGQAQLTKFLKQSAFIPDAGKKMVEQAAATHWPKPRDLFDIKSEGLMGKAHGFIENLSQHAGHGGETVGRVIFGENHPERAEMMGNIAHIGTKYVAPAIIANEAYRRTLKHSPTFNEVRQGVLGAVPGTQEYKNKELEYELLSQGYPPGGGYQ